MIVHEQRRPMRLKGRHGSIWAILVSVTCFLRGLPLFFSTTPKTPLRVLCIMAFDTLHVLRTSKPLPGQRLRVLAALLDFGACANAALDNKVFSPKEYQATRQRLRNAGISPSVDEYLRQLRKLEGRRPSLGGDHRQFDEVRSYRAAVARLSLGMVATTAIGNQGLDEGIRATFGDDDLEILFRIVMQCQIIDDVLDYSKDTSVGLPSFLTASESLPQALELTRLAALGYAGDRDLPRSGDLFPLRLALSFVSTCARLVILLGRLRQKIHLVQQLPERVYERRLLTADVSTEFPSSTTSWS